MKDISISNDLTQSCSGTLRLRQFSKSLIDANVVNASNSKSQSILSLTQATTGKGHLPSSKEGRHERVEHRESIIGFSSLQMERFEKRDQFDPAKLSSLTSSSRPENEQFIDSLRREKSLHIRTKICPEGKAKGKLVSLETEDRDKLTRIPCDYCDHLFLKEADLNDHIGRFHAGVKKFVCFVCHKRFKRKQSLENHVLMIHGVSGSGAAVSGSVVTNANDGGNYNNGNNHSGRNSEMNSRDQMIMMMLEKEKADLAAGGKRENGDICDN